MGGPPAPGVVVRVGHSHRLWAAPGHEDSYNQGMVRQLEAVFENGVLRPLEPLSLPDRQRVILTLTEAPRNEPVRSRKAEQEWLSRHGSEYVGQWVALEGDALVSHGPKATATRDEARQKGVERPLLVYVSEQFGEPSAGWF